MGATIDTERFEAPTGGLGDDRGGVSKRGTFSSLKFQFLSRVESDFQRCHIKGSPKFCQKRSSTAIINVVRKSQTHKKRACSSSFGQNLLTKNPFKLNTERHKTDANDMLLKTGTANNDTCTANTNNLVGRASD